MKILIAVDGSVVTRRMLDYLATHDEWLGAAHRYTVIHVMPPVPGPAASALGRDTLKGYYADGSEAVFKPIRSFLAKCGIEASYVAKVGHAAELIAKLADSKDFDLVVMGSHGHGAIGNLILGSVATKVLAGCSKPVLLIR
jgi:nucleotide-binding universal stress UspA family protein